MKTEKSYPRFALNFPGASKEKLMIACFGILAFLVIVCWFLFGHKGYVAEAIEIHSDGGLILKGPPGDIAEQFREIIIYTITKGYFENPGKPGNFVYEDHYISTIKSAKAEFRAGSITIDSWSLAPDHGYFWAYLVSWRKELIYVFGVVSVDVHGNRYLVRQISNTAHADQFGRRAPR